MAIQIWDAQAGQYKSADLARFGGSGTLTEALVWDGTKYVKVWPNTPTYPVSGEWSGPMPTEWTTIADHTITESGTYTITFHVNSAAHHFVLAARNGDTGDAIFVSGPAYGNVGSSATVALSAGTVVSFMVLSGAGTGTATWSITKS